MKGQSVWIGTYGMAVALSIRFVVVGVPSFMRQATPYYKQTIYADGYEGIAKSIG